MKSIEDVVDELVSETYNLKEFVSIREEDRVLYFSEWRKPFLEVRVVNNNLVVTELFDRVPGSVIYSKKKVG